MHIASHIKPTVLQSCHAMVPSSLNFTHPQTWPNNKPDTLLVANGDCNIYH